MQNSNKLIRFVAVATGFLCGGLFGVSVGSLFGNELAVIVCYSCGALLGAFSGPQLLKLRKIWLAESKEKEQ